MSKKGGYKLMKRVRKTIRMPEWLTNQLVKIADFNGISVNALITNACLEMVKDFTAKYQNLEDDENNK